MSRMPRISFASAAIVGVLTSTSIFTSAFQSPSRTWVASSSHSHLHRQAASNAFAPISQQAAVVTSVGIGKKGSPTALPALPAALSSVASPLGSVSVLAFVVLVHEAGHFLAARSFGIKVEEFAVGVGPKILGFRRKADGDSEDEIEYNLRAIPLGGYVRFPENYNTTEAMIAEDKARKERIEYRKKKSELRVAGSGVAGVVAGESAEESPLSGRVLLSIITFGLLGRKEQEEADRIAKEEADRIEKEKANAAKSWKNIFSFGPKQAKSRITEIEKPKPPPEIEYYDDPNLLQNRPWPQRAIVLVGGVVFNILLAFACYFGELTVGDGIPQPIFREGALITQAPRVDGASNGILQKGDVIVGINGRPLMTTRSPNVMQSQEAINDFISTIRKTSPGESLRVSIIQAAAAAESAKPVEVVLTPQLNADKAQSIGVMLSPNYVRTEKLHAESVPDAIVKASKATSDITGATARSLLTLLGNVLIGKGGSGQSVSGPIGLIKQGSDVVSSAAEGRDIAAVVGFAAAISANLAVVNSLPLPALDGGQLVFVLAEGLTGKKIDQKRQEEINATALFLLLAFSLSTAVGDVGRLIK